MYEYCRGIGKPQAVMTVRPRLSFKWNCYRSVNVVASSNRAHTKLTIRWKMKNREEEGKLRMAADFISHWIFDKLKQVFRISDYAYFYIHFFYLFLLLPLFFRSALLLLLFLSRFILWDFSLPLSFSLLGNIFWLPNWLSYCRLYVV